MSEPMSPAAAEATEAATMDVEYGGHTYKVVASTDDWSLDLLEEYERGRSLHAVMELLGPKQYAAFKDRHNTARAINEMMDVLAVAYGFKDAGESGAS